MEGQCWLGDTELSKQALTYWHSEDGLALGNDFLSIMIGPVKNTRPTHPSHPKSRLPLQSTVFSMNILFFVTITPTQQLINKEQ